MICLKHGIQMQKVAIISGIWQWKCPICDKEKGVGYGQRLQSNTQTESSRKKKPNAGTGTKGWSPRTKI